VPLHLPPEGAASAPAVRALVSDLTSGVATALGDHLVGLYLYGSLVTGDFDEQISDVDLLAVTRAHLDDERFRRLDAVHRGVEQRHPTWTDRIEVTYLAAATLATLTQTRSPIAVISPGEPFHLTDADWLINAYIVRDKGLTVSGPPPHTLIREITTTELLHALRIQMEQWRQWVHSATHPGFQAYAILTACRGLYTHEHTTIVSKQRSAQWAKRQLPPWADLIDHALLLRTLGGHAGKADHGETVRFVNAVADRINGPAAT
jgi:hypothetical protein